MRTSTLYGPVVRATGRAGFRPVRQLTDAEYEALCECACSLFPHVHAKGACAALRAAAAESSAGEGCA